MRIPRIFQVFPSNVKQWMLNEQAARHLSKVLRLRAGDHLIVFNGDGHDYCAQMTRVQYPSVEIKILDQIQENRESPLYIHLGQAISKGDRMDYTLQKATELGVGAITPLFSTRSEVHLLKGERLEKKMAHWQKVIISACEQCGRNRIPTLFLPKTLLEWINGVQETRKWVLDHEGMCRLRETGLPKTVALLVGPEGGLTSEEKESAYQQGFEGLQLGPRTLRTETASVVGITVLQCWAGDMARFQQD